MSEVPEGRLPLIAIVGRPNVGKSTLFNRYAGHRRALVEDVPGVTRDRIVEEIEVSDRHALLVDTAGLDPVAEEGLPSAVQAQAWSAVVFWGFQTSRMLGEPCGRVVIRPKR